MATAPNNFATFPWRKHNTRQSVAQETPDHIYTSCIVYTLLQSLLPRDREIATGLIQDDITVIILRALKVRK
jgi:hypothetical protein